MEKVSVFTAGKINLSLNVLGKRGDMHLIDSIMASIDIGDIVTARKRNDNQIRISFEGDYSGNQNFYQLNQNSTVKKTADYLCNKFGSFGVDISVQKNLPVAFGLGGSAADIAATLTALSCLFDFDKCGLDIFAAGAELGSDVPFMLKGGCVRVGGTGEILTPINSKQSLNIVLVSDAAGCNSKDVYASFDLLGFGCNNALAPDKNNFCPSGIVCDNDIITELLKNGDPAAISLFANALTPAAESLCGKIESARHLLLECGAINAIMTGSGSAVAGFFDGALAAGKTVQALSKKGLYAKACILSNIGTRIL